MKTYDSFPVNLLETSGRIDREPFTFTANKYEIWQNGQCIENETCESVITTNIDSIGNINVQIEDSSFSDYIIPSMTFSEISENKDRILWSNDLFGGGFNAEYKEASFMSLFFISGILSKVAFSINEPKTMIEFIL